MILGLADTFIRPVEAALVGLRRGPNQRGFAMATSAAVRASDF